MSNLAPMRALQFGFIVFIVSLMAPSSGATLPAYYAQVLAGAVGFQVGGASLDVASGYTLNSAAALALEQQLKRVLGADAAEDLNITAVRALADFDLYRLLTLAAIGNFTTAKASSWQQPVQVLVVPSTGLFVVSGMTDASDVTVRVLLIIMCAVHFKKWMQEQVSGEVGRKMH